MTLVNDGWHKGPDGQPEPGFLEGTAWQPDGWADHIDAWGSPHPGNLATCRTCSLSADLHLEDLS